MNRRTLIKGAITIATTNSIAQPISQTLMQDTKAGKPRYYLLTSYETRNDLKPNRLLDFLQQVQLPALKKYGIDRIGAFRGQTGFTTPGALTIAEFTSLDEVQSVQEKLLGDSAYQASLAAFEGSSELSYLRYEVSILKAFAGHPLIEITAQKLGADNKPLNRIFEFRTYESRTSISLRNKIEMFNQEEIKIFRDCDFSPIFFGECVAGARMPSLSYLVAFDSMEHRDKAWGRFTTNADFNRIKTKPNWTDPEAVTNIRSSFLRALPFSVIR